MQIRSTEAVTVAAEACAEDTKGQTCYICTQALHWKTKEGLVRGCVPRDGGLRARGAGGAGEDFGRGGRGEQFGDDRWEEVERWYACGLCEQEYHGIVRCALGWACWKTHGAAETDVFGAGDEPAWERFMNAGPLRGRVVRERPSCLRAAPWRIEDAFSSRRAILRPRMTNLDGLMKACACDKTHILDG